MSIGDSLLDYFSKQEIIKNHQKNWFTDTDGKFKGSTFSIDNNSSLYEGINVCYKSNDNNFIIESIDGFIYYANNIEECHLKKEEVFEELSNLFKNVDWEDSQYENSLGKFTSTFLRFESGDRISIQCYDWNKKTEKEKNWTDHLRVIIKSAEFSYWLDNN